MPDMRASVSPRAGDIFTSGPAASPTPAAPAVENVRRLHRYLTREFTFAFQITIADNASADGTLLIAQRLARELPEAVALHLDRKGRGHALRAAWSRSKADVVAYMDADLSTDLSALEGLLLPLLQLRGDIAIGSRLMPGAWA